MNEATAQSNKREVIWQETVGDAYSPYVAVSGDGIEIAVGGTVYVRSVYDWHKLSIQAENQQSSTLAGFSNARTEPTKADQIGQYLYMLCEIQRCGHEVHTEIDNALKSYRVEIGL